MSLSGLPQLYKILKSKSSKGISVYFWVIIIHGMSWWLYYGILLESISIVITNSTGIIINSFVLFFTIKYKRKEKDGKRNSQKKF